MMKKFFKLEYFSILLNGIVLFGFFVTFTTSDEVPFPVYLFMLLPLLGFIGSINSLRKKGKVWRFFSVFSFYALLIFNVFGILMKSIDPYAMFASLVKFLTLLFEN